MDTQNKIACIGWGSLIWNPGTLPRLGGWHRDGPMLPVEFARESADRKITLVICKEVPEVQTLWTLLDVEDLESARQHLGLREYAEAKPRWIEANIGFWDRFTDRSHGEGTDAIAPWAEAKIFRASSGRMCPAGFRAAGARCPPARRSSLTCALWKARSAQQPKTMSVRRLIRSTRPTAN